MSIGIFDDVININENGTTSSMNNIYATPSSLSSSPSSHIISYNGSGALTPEENDAHQKILKLVEENKILRKNLLNGTRIIDELTEKLKVRKMDWQTNQRNMTNNKQNNSQFSKLREELQCIKESVGEELQDTSLIESIELVTNLLDSTTITQPTNPTEINQIVEWQTKYRKELSAKEELKEQFDQYKILTENLQKEIEKKDKELSENKSRIDSMEKQIQDISVEVFIPQTQRDNDKKIKDLQKEIEYKVAELNASKIAIDKLRKELHTTNGNHKLSMEKIQPKLKELNLKLAQSQKENGALKKDIEKLEGIIKSKQKTGARDRDKINELLQFKKDVCAVYEDLPSDGQNIFLSRISKEELGELAYSNRSLNSSLSEDSLDSKSVILQDDTESPNSSLNSVDSPSKKDNQQIDSCTLSLQEMEQIFSEKEEKYTQQIRSLQETLLKLEQELRVKDSSLKKTRGEYQILYDTYKKLNEEKQIFEEHIQETISELENQLQSKNGEIDHLNAKSLQMEEKVKFEEHSQQKISELEKHLLSRNGEIDHLNRKSKNQEENMQLLQLQMEQYEHDFRVERAARESQQGQLLDQEEANEKLKKQLESLRKELNKNANSRMFDQRYSAEPSRRHDSFSQYQDSRNVSINSLNRNDYQNNARGGCSDDSGGSLPLYESIDTIEINCPKCNVPMPDQDSLQVHLVDCLE